MKVYWEKLWESDKSQLWSSHCGTVEMNLTRNHEVTGFIPGLAQWVEDPVLLWLWCMPVAIALIRPLAWEPPYAVGVALEKSKRQKIIIIIIKFPLWRSG